MSAAQREALRAVEFLAPLADDDLDELIARGRVVRCAEDERVVSELEPGADVYVVIAGEAQR